MPALVLIIIINLATVYKRKDCDLEAIIHSLCSIHLILVEEASKHWCKIHPDMNKQGDTDIQQSSFVYVSKEMK